MSVEKVKFIHSHSNSLLNWFLLIFQVAMLVAREVSIACRMGVEVPLESLVLSAETFTVFLFHVAKFIIVLLGGNSCWWS